MLLKLLSFLEAKRRLAFVGKSGFDLFGNNELFAPRIKYEVLKSVVEDIREYAADYENSYNSMRELIENEQTVEALQQVCLKTIIATSLVGTKGGHIK